MSKRRRIDSLGSRSRRNRKAASMQRSADNRAGVLLGALRKLEERRAHLHYVSLAAEQVRDASARRRWYLHHRFVGFDGEERLIGDNVIALVNVPGNDLRLFKPFS